MKKLLRKSIVLLLALVFVVMSIIPVAASQATSYSYTLDDEGEYVRTQDAYLPDRTITSLGLSDPEDMIIDQNQKGENILLISDTGNKRILIYNLDTEKTVNVLNNTTVPEFSGEIAGFNTPKGIFLTKDDFLYVADSAAKTVYKFKKKI